jgi:cytochrome oxidase assembly protein ShyY1
VRAVLLDRRWLGGLALAVAVAVGCVLLGTWQWQRREARLERNAAVTGNYDRSAVPLEALGTDLDEPLPAARSWTPVLLAGEYLVDDAVLLRQRPLGGRAGYHALVPFRDDSGAVLLVDRGFVPAGDTGDAPDAVPAPPAGRVEALVRLRPAEPPDARDAPAGQVRTITPDLVLGARPTGSPSTGEAGRPVTGAYGVLATEEPAPAAAPVPLPRPTVDEGPHLSYAFQWFVFAGGALVGWAVLARRAVAEGAGSGPGGGSPGGGGDRPGTRRAATRRPTTCRATVRRPTAEEEEDALLDAAERRAGRGA